MAPDATISIATDEERQLRILVERDRVKCFLDGQLLHEHAYGVIPYLTSVTTLDEDKNELIVKMVNPSPFIIDTELEIRGTAIEEIVGEQLILTADEPNAFNSMERPTCVVPASSPLQLNGKMYSVPAHAVVILKIKL
ncbi:hypothetical protein D3C77_605130 [compost metagenome]